MARSRTFLILWQTIHEPYNEKNKSTVHWDNQVGLQGFALVTSCLL